MNKFLYILSNIAVIISGIGAIGIVATCFQSSPILGFVALAVLGIVVYSIISDIRRAEQREKEWEQRRASLNLS